MSAHMPLMMQNLFNTPIMLSQRKAEMIVAALAGKLDVRQLITETATYDQVALRDMAGRGREEARLDRDMRSRRSNIPSGPMMVTDWYGERPYRLDAQGIAIIDVLGTLTRTWGIDPESGSTGYDGILTKLAFAMDDPGCKGIWFRINSGGGGADGLFDVTDAIYKCSARFGGKPMWAYAGGYAYSAAYAIMSACDKAYAPPLGGVGSVGAIAVFVDLTAAMADAGIEAVIFRSAARKAIGVGGMESLDEQERAHIQEQINEAGAYFVDKVSVYRGMAKSKVSQTEGTDYTAGQAKAIGFIDDILSEQDAWAKFGRLVA